MRLAIGAEMATVAVEDGGGVVEILPRAFAIGEDERDALGAEALDLEELERAGLSRSALAKKIGVSKGRISTALGGGNLTLGTIADILWACGKELEDLSSAQLGVSIVDPDVIDLANINRVATAKVSADLDSAIEMETLSSARQIA